MRNELTWFESMFRRLGVAGIFLASFSLWPLCAHAVVRADDGGLAPANMALRFYQKYISDLRYGNCRFEPSCSQYAIEITRERGLLAGSVLAADRLIRCNGGAHQYHDRGPGGRLSDPSGGGLPAKTRPEVPEWLMPVYDRSPPLAGAPTLDRRYTGNSADADSAGADPAHADSADTDSVGADSSYADPVCVETLRPRLYLEDCAGFAEALADEGDCERAATEYLRVAYLGRTPELRFWAHMRIGSCLYANEIWDAAAAEFRDAAGSGSVSAERSLARFMAAGSYFNALDYDLCSDLLSRVDFSERQSDADCVEAGGDGTEVTREHWLFLKGLSLMGLADWAGAAGSFEEVLAACPRSLNRDRAVFLAGQANLGPGLPHRSPTAASVFSAVIPGSGQMYSGRFTDGLRHLIFDGLLIYTVYWLAREENYTGAYLVAGITIPFYVGNIVGAKRSAEWFNSTKRTEFIRDSINATR